MNVFYKQSANKAAEIFGITEWKNDLSLILIYHKLSTLLGFDDMLIHHWFHSPNKHLDGKVPANLVTTNQGTNSLLDYLSFFIDK